MKTKVAVLFGGKSAEFDVSLKSATNIYNAIDEDNFEKELLGVDLSGNWRYNADYAVGEVNLSEKDYFADALLVYLKSSAGRVDIVAMDTNIVMNSFDIAFPIIHGTFGEDGTLQGILRSLKIAFVGPDVLGSAIAMDKDVAKRLLREAAIPIADYVTLDIHNRHAFSFEQITKLLGHPLFVKPANAGSSVGVSKVENDQEYAVAVSEAFRYDRKILVEEAVFGKEVECAVLGNEQVLASVLGEITSATNFYSYQDKYISFEGITTQIPADIDEQIADQIRSVAIKAFRVLCCEGMARVDFFLRDDGSYVLNEINTLPGFTKTSMYPKLWESTGLCYSDLLTELLSLATQRNDRDRMLGILPNF